MSASPEFEPPAPPPPPEEDRENAPPPDFAATSTPQNPRNGAAAAGSLTATSAAGVNAATAAATGRALTANGAANAGSNSKLTVKIRGWNGVATWKWVANDDTCGICRVAFEACCPDCKIPGDDCPLVWGECTHHFHIHCIMKWLQSQGSSHLCPMCRQEWKFKE